jgi:hypothetical protein
MSSSKGCQLLAAIAAFAALAGCASNRIAKCEGHLVQINPAPPKPAVVAPAPMQKSQSPRGTEHKP